MDEITSEEFLFQLRKYDTVTGKKVTGKVKIEKNVGSSKTIRDCDIPVLEVLKIGWESLALENLKVDVLKIATQFKIEKLEISNCTIGDLLIISENDGDIENMKLSGKITENGELSADVKMITNVLLIGRFKYLRF